jgi:hypothetical protein
MKYPDGQEARLGDRVELWEQNEGAVVCSLDTNEYSADYPREHWQVLIVRRRSLRRWRRRSRPPVCRNDARPAAPTIARRCS